MRRRHLESVSAAPYGRCFASFVSSRSLSVRGSWGAAPSAFWYGAPGGTQGPLGKGGAAERWRVTPSVSGVTRHGAQPATTRTHKRNAPAVAVQFMPLRKPAPTISNHKNPARSFLAPGGKLDACFIVLGYPFSSTASRCPTPAHKYPPCAGCSERFPGRSHRTGLHPPPPRRK